MRQITSTILAVAASLLFLACGQDATRNVTSQGAAYEIIVVASNDQWQGVLGDSVRSIMQEPVPYINQYEPLYDILRVLPGSFEGLIAKHRNVLLLRTGEQYREPAMTVSYDVYANPQVVVTLAGADQQSLADYVSQYRQQLVSIFEITERDRNLSVNSRYGDKRIAEAIHEKFGFRIDVPKGYTVRSQLDDFMWLSFEYPRASQGVIIYSYPFSDMDDFTVGPLVERRNSFVSNIPAEGPGSYMTTFDGFVPQLRYIRLADGRQWAEMRGFWDVHNDFMGGPFVSYSTLDAANDRIICLDFYVYSPDKPKRNFLRPLEHLIHSVKFQ